MSCVSQKRKWHEISGEELQISDLQDISQGSGIYIWKRRIRYKNKNLENKYEFISWVDEIAKKPTAIINDSMLNYCTSIEKLKIGGGSITDDKQAKLEKVCENRLIRKVMAAFIQNLSIHAAPIYIGSAKNIKVRIRQHIRGETGLLDYVKRLELDLDDLSLCYYEFQKGVREEEDEIIKNLLDVAELVAQRVLAPFGTDRPG